MAGRNSRRERERRKLERMRAEREALDTSRRVRHKRWAIAGSLVAVAALLAASAWLAPELPSATATSASLPLVLLIGLTAGGLSCLAVQGGLLATVVAQREELTGHEADAALERNAAPILWFLGGKLVAYTILGALLGALGALAQPSPQLRGGIQLATVVLMIGTALHFLGVHPVFRYFILQPPAFVTRRIRRWARGADAATPAALGVLTIFLPCGVTQAMQLLAINSSSPVVGAAVLFAFTLGTSPVFFALGYSATKLGEAAHARFLRFAAVGILVVAVFSLNAALRLSGAPVTLADVKNVFLPAPAAVPAQAASAKTGGVQEARIKVRANGYEPSRIRIRSGEPARVVFQSDGVAGCTLALIFKDQQMILPETGETPIELPAQEPGSIEYSCAMGMYGGSIEVV